MGRNAVQTRVDLNASNLCLRNSGGANYMSLLTPRDFFFTTNKTKPARGTRSAKSFGNDCQDSRKRAGAVCGF